MLCDRQITAVQIYWESLRHYNSLQNETHSLEFLTIRLAKESETDGTLHLQSSTEMLHVLNWGNRT